MPLLADKCRTSPIIAPRWRRWFKLPMPTLGLGAGGPRGRGDLVVESLRRIALHASAGSVADCGHFIPDEKPVELASHLREFLAKQVRSAD